MQHGAAVPGAATPFDAEHRHCLPCPLPVAWSPAQVPDEALAQLQEVVGASLRQARRALRFCGGDVEAAVEFVVQQRQRREVCVGVRGGGRKGGWRMAGPEQCLLAVQPTPA